MVVHKQLVAYGSSMSLFIEFSRIAARSTNKQKVEGVFAELPCLLRR